MFYSFFGMQTNTASNSLETRKYATIFVHESLKVET